MAGPPSTAPDATPAALPSVSQRRRERERQATRARLLQAAREIAAADGWQAVTIRRIADRLEYTSPVLYQHFPGKDALLLELVTEGFRQVAGTLQAATQQPPERMLEAVALAYWDHAFAAPEMYRAMNGLDGVPFGTAATPQEARQAFHVVRRALQRLAAARGRRLRDAAGAVDTLWAFLHGFVSLTMSGRIAGGTERARELMLQALPPLFDSMLS